MTRPENYDQFGPERQQAWEERPIPKVDLPALRQIFEFLIPKPDELLPLAAATFGEDHDAYIRLSGAIDPQYSEGEEREEILRGFTGFLKYYAHWFEWAEERDWPELYPDAQT